MTLQLISRPEMLNATLHLGGTTIELADYAATGLLALAIGPRGKGKTNAGQVIAEQLSEQGWVSVLIDPEGELGSMYGAAVASPEALAALLESRTQPIVVVDAKTTYEFLPYGKVIAHAADQFRKPIFVMIDEGQVFSQNKHRKDGIGEAADLINDFAERGRKRALDLFITTHRYTGSVHRSLFYNKNLTLVGCQEDPTVWSSLAPQFRASKIEYSDLNALSTGEFFCLSSRGTEKIKMPMAKALKAVAKPAKKVKRALPATYREWSHALSSIPTQRLQALTPALTDFLGALAGLTLQQVQSGTRALQDEMESRA